MGKILSIANQKGGVGKTTTAINLSACLAAAGRDVLLIDLDPQGNATSGLGIDKSKLTSTICNILLTGANYDEVVQNTNIEKLKILPANNTLVSAEASLLSAADGRTRLRKIIRGLANTFPGLVIIDCPPSLGMLTVNALTASDSILAPIQCEFFALEGMASLWETITLVRRLFNPRLELEGILLTMYDARTNMSKKIEEQLRERFKDKVFKTIIHRNIRLCESTSHGKPIILYDLKCEGSKSYIELAKEVIENEKRSIAARSL